MIWRTLLTQSYGEGSHDLRGRYRKENRMSTAQIIATLSSLPFVLALVALVRQ